MTLPILFEEPKRLPSGSHSIFGASAAKRIITCTASVLASLNAPDDESEYAALGNVAHYVADAAYRMRYPTSRFLDSRFLTTVRGRERLFVCDQAMVEGTQQYLDWCAEEPGDHFSERRIEITNWTPPAEYIKAHLELPQTVEQWTTADHFIFAPGKVTVKDFKYGEGVKVYAFENPQLILHGLAAIFAYNFIYEFKKVSLQIAQPRLDHFDVWDTDVNTLRKHGAAIKAKFIESLTDARTFGPSIASCQFCRIKATCRARADAIHADTAIAFDPITETFKPEDPNELSIEELAHAWTTRRMYMSRLKAVEDVLMARLQAGAQGLGLKLVRGRSNRRFRNTAEADGTLELLGVPESVRFTKTLIGPAPAEKLLDAAGKAILAPLIVKPPGKPAIVPDNDPRPTLDADQSDAFVSIEDEVEWEGEGEEFDD